MTAENHGRGDAGERASRRAQAQQWVHAETLAAPAEIVGGAERVSEGEHAAGRPPEGDFLPPPVPADAAELERTHALLGYDVMRDLKLRGQLGAVAVVPVKELDDARRLPGRLDARLDSVPEERVDQPDLRVDDDHMGGALHELVDGPPEAAVELVAEPDAH
jgi:hypothetical protein